MSQNIITFDSYKQLIDIDDFNLPKVKYKKETELYYRMIGILFARPDSNFTKNEILPHLEYFHQRSGQNFDIYCAGYSVVSRIILNEFDKINKKIDGADGRDWSFSDKLFNALRSLFETKTKWRYSGSADLILTNIKYSLLNADIDFSSAIVCKLEEMKLDKAIISVESFLEDICKYVEQYNGHDPTWGVSTKLSVHKAGSAIKRIILSLIPKKIGDDIKRISHFAVIDINKTT